MKGTFRKVWRAGELMQSQPGPGFLPFSKRELVQGTQSSILPTKAFFSIRIEEENSTATILSVSNK